MAGKGKKGKSKGGNKPKAQAPKQVPAVETGAAAATAATNSSTPIENELITPGALDLKINDPEVAAVAGEDAGDKAAPSVEKEAATAAPAVKAVDEVKETPVAAAETLKEEEPVVAKTQEEPIVAAEKQKDAPVVAEKQREAPIAAEKLQKDAPIPAAVGAQKDVSAPTTESKQTPIIGGASAAPLAAGVASTKSNLLANNNPFIAAPLKETPATNPFDSPTVAAPVKDVPTPASKTEAFEDVPIQSKEAAPAPKAVQQPETRVPTHATPPASTNPYTQPLKTSNEAVTKPEKKVAGDGFEPAPVAKPTAAAATEPYPAPSAIENLKRAPVPEDKKTQSPAHTPLPTPFEYDTAGVTETTPYQPPAPAAAVSQQETAALAPAYSQTQGTTTGTTGTTAAGGVRSPSPSPAPRPASATPLTELKLMQTSASDAEQRSGCCVVQ